MLDEDSVKRKRIASRFLERTGLKMSIIVRFWKTRLMKTSPGLVGE